MMSLALDVTCLYFARSKQKKNPIWLSILPVIVRLGSQLEHKSDGIRTSSQSLPLRQWPVDLDACALPLENRLGRACQCTGALVVDTLHAKLYVHSLVPPPRSICICICAYTQSDPRPCTNLKATDNDRRPTRMPPTKRGNFYVCICTCTYNFFFFLQNFVSGLKTYTGTPGLSSISLSLYLYVYLFSSPNPNSTPIPTAPNPYLPPFRRSSMHMASQPVDKSNGYASQLLHFSLLIHSPFSLLIYHYHHHHFSPLISAFSLPSPSICTYDSESVSKPPCEIRIPVSVIPGVMQHTPAS